MSAVPPPEQRTLLRVLLVAAGIALAAILLPFYGTLLWSIVVALLFRPLFIWLLPRVGGRRNFAAFLTVGAVLLLAVLPLALLAAGLAGEAAALVERLQAADFDAAGSLRRFVDWLPDWARGLLRRLGLGDLGDLQRQLSALLGAAGRAATGPLMDLGMYTFDAMLGLFVMLYVDFFLIRDGNLLLLRLSHSLPLRPALQRELARQFASVLRATVKGNVLVAALQGALGGVAFMVLGIPGALLWGVAMALLSLLPSIGAALVWGPVVVWLLVSGQLIQGLGLLAFGVFVISLVDNLLRPRLVGRDMRLPDWVVLVTTLGGMAVFGIHGFVLGPAIAAMFLVLWRIVAAPHVHPPEDPS